MINFYMKYDDSKEFKQLIKALDTLIDADEVVFELSNEKIRVAQMDAARVSLTILELEKEACEEWKVESEGRFGLNISHLLRKVLKNIKAKNESVKLTVSDWEKVTVELQYFDLKRNFGLPVLDMEKEQIPIPKIIPTVQAKLVVDALQTIMKDLNTDENGKKQDWGHTIIMADQDSINFADENQFAPFNASFKKHSDSLLDIEVKEEAKARYQTILLSNFVQSVAPLADIVDLEYATDTPIKLTPFLARPGLRLEYYIAPRVDTE